MGNLKIIADAMSETLGRPIYESSVVVLPKIPQRIGEAYETYTATCGEDVLIAKYYGNVISVELQ